MCNQGHRGESKDVTNGLHRELRRVDVGIPHHEFLEGVILNSAMRLLQLDLL